MRSLIRGRPLYLPLDARAWGNLYKNLVVLSFDAWVILNSIVVFRYAVVFGGSVEVGSGEDVISEEKQP